MLRAALLFHYIFFVLICSFLLVRRGIFVVVLFREPMCSRLFIGYDPLNELVNSAYQVIASVFHVRSVASGTDSLCSRFVQSLKICTYVNCWRYRSWLQRSCVYIEWFWNDPGNWAKVSKDEAKKGGKKLKISKMYWMKGLFIEDSRLIPEENSEFRGRLGSKM